MIERLLARGYAVKDFSEALVDRRHLILRHDVDQSLDEALPIAELEASMGIRSTYFILLTSALYNPRSRPGRQRLRDIAGLGHRIGLHFDASLQPAGTEDEAVRQMGRELSDLAGVPVGCVSSHRPGASGMPEADLLGGLINAYARRFTGQMLYVSDSRGAWRFGAPESQLDGHPDASLQLLTHPIWWTGEEPAKPTARLDRFLWRHLDRLRHDLSENITGYDPEAAMTPRVEDGPYGPKW